MIAVADINTLWRLKPFAALSHLTPVLGLAPHRLGNPPLSQAPLGQLSVRSVALPPGWASVLSPFTAVRISSLLRRTGTSKLVVTTPHYHSLVRRVAKRIPVFYYCSDDYSQYAGWGGDALLKKEAAVVRLSRHSFFVSQTLADRAVCKYDVQWAKISISPNATEERFLEPVGESSFRAIRASFPQLRHPIAGVVGGINGRLDFELLLKCAKLPSLGTLVLLGGVDTACTHPALNALRNHPKVLFTGQRPHEELPAWMQMLDTALIPYSPTPLNRACSPMRLYDHLAAGKPIVATTACTQIESFGNLLDVSSDHSRFTARVEALLATPQPVSQPMRSAVEKGHLWSHRATALLNVLEPNKTA